MGRVARLTQATCRSAGNPGWRAKAAAAGIFACAALGLLDARPAHADDDPVTGVGAPAASASAFGKPEGGIFGKPQKLDKSVPLYLQGDQLIYDTKGNRVVAKGNVEIFYNNNILTADEVIYDQGANTLTAVGNVEVKEANGNVIRADRYTLTDDFRDGFVQSLSVVARDDSRISAERGERREGNITEFTKARFTSCKSEGNTPPLWCVGAQKIIHDQSAATITYQDAWFEILGYPVLYMPYFQHPDPSVKRKSGFLMPLYGNSAQLGFFTEIPYYFALSPNYDFTFRPRYLSEQGVLWQGDWRHKLADGEYMVKLAGIDQDGDNLPATAASRRDLDEWRGSVETRGQFSLSSWWNYGWDAVIESDDTFRRFYKLDSILQTDRVNKAYLTGLSERSYFGANLYHFGGLLVNDTDQAGSVVHPIIDHNYVFNDPVLGGEASWDTNVLSFSRSDASQGSIVNKRSDDQRMNRIVTKAKWRRKMIDTLGITYTPFAELRGDIYQLDNYVDPLDGGISQEEGFVRGLATGGATVAYPWIAAGAGGSHVIEPIGQVIARQASVDQNDQPNEDAKSLVFDDTNLFETTKFSGYDRVETGVRANVGVQYTFQSNSGPYARVLAGQSYHIAGDNPYDNPGRIDPLDRDTAFLYSPRSGLESNSSDYVLGLYLAPTNIFRIISQSRFDQSDLDLSRMDVTGRVDYGPMFTQVTYAYTASDPEFDVVSSQQDVIGAMGLRLTERWSVFGSVRYDIDAQERLTDSIQLSYLDECFMLSATYSETFIEDPLRDIEPDRTVMLRFELKNLGGFNYSTNVTDFVGSEAESPATN